MRIKRKDLEIFLEQLEKIPNPKLQFEQYATPARVAANLLWYAGIEQQDIFEKTVLDLGCGSGILSIGAAYLGATNVVGIDIDFESLLIAKKNSKEMDFVDQCHWICQRVETCYLNGIDTILMNPPFGMRKESISRDRNFIQKALVLAASVYSIIPFSKETREFYRRFIEDYNFKIKTIQQMDFEMNHLYQFHKKKRHIITVDLYHIVKK